MKKNRGNIAFLIFILVILAVAFWVMSMPTAGDRTYEYSDLWELFETEQVKSFTLSDNVLTLQLHQPTRGKTELTYRIASFSVF